MAATADEPGTRRPSHCEPIIFRDAPEQVRAAALALLDQVCRPMNVREIEQALRAAGLSKTQRALLAGGLKRIAIVAIIGPDDAPVEARNAD